MKKFIKQYKFSFLVPLSVSLLVFVGYLTEIIGLFQSCGILGCYGLGLGIMIAVAGPVGFLIELLAIESSIDDITFILIAILFYICVGLIIDIWLKIISNLNKGLKSKKY